MSGQETLDSDLHTYHTGLGSIYVYCVHQRFPLNGALEIMMKLFIKRSSINAMTVVKNYVTKKDLSGTSG